MKPCPFCGTVGSYTDECSPGIFRNICAACDSLGPPAKSATLARERWGRRPVQDTCEMTATEIAARVACIRTRKEHSHLREQAVIHHARAIINLYDDGGVR